MTASDGSPTIATQKPLSSPHRRADPEGDDDRRPPSETPWLVSQATTTAARPIIDATERSISPLMMTKVMIRTTIAFSMPSWNRLIWFWTVR